MSASRSRTLKFWVPPVLWMALIFSASSISGKHIPNIHISNFDKIIHFFEFFIFGALLVRALSHSFHTISLKKLIIVSIAIAVLYALTDEWHQRFVIDRTSDVFDLVTDFIGASAGAIIYDRFKMKKGKG